MLFGVDGAMVRKSRHSSPSVTGVSLDQASATISSGDTLTLSITLTPSGAVARTIAWSSSDTSVATVDQAGTVTAVAAGSATITVTVDGAYTDTCVVTVQAAASGYYRASGCGIAAVDGDYDLYSGTHGTTSAVYYNGSYYLYYSTMSEAWIVDVTLGTWPGAYWSNGSSEILSTWAVMYSGTSPAPTWTAIN